MALRLTMPGSNCDPDQARRAFEVLADPGAACELRGLPTGESRILPGRHLEGLVRAFCEIARNNNSVYLCLNPVPEGLKPARAVKDEHVTRRRWVMVDIDPAKAKGQEDNPASAPEHDAAHALAADVHAYLGEQGWPAPVVVDSGNGAYLLYRCDLPNDEDGKQLVRAFLHRLWLRFSDSRGSVDKKTFNAARIAKVPGASSRKVKSAASAERPYRLARLLHAPDPLECVTREQLENALPEINVNGTAAETVVESRRPAGLKMVMPGGGNSPAYARGALQSAIGMVALSTPAGAGGSGRNDTLFRAAVGMFNFVASGLLTDREVRDELGKAASQKGLSDEEIARTLDSAARIGLRKPREAPEGPRHRDSDNGQAEPPRWRVTLDGAILLEGSRDDLPAAAPDGGLPATRAFEMLTLGALVDREYPEPAWAVPGIMSEGLNILAGMPKGGKSMFALNLALTIAGGGKALGDIQVMPADVLYLSLEDKHRRVKARALKMLQKIDPALTPAIRRRLVVSTSWPRQDEGGLEMIDLWRQKADCPGLVIIDVWAHFGPVEEGRGSAYRQDYKHMAAVQSYVNRHRLTGFVLHHTRKSAAGGKEPEDFVQELSGTLGLAGPADGVMVLMRSRDEVQATLHVTGRDVPDKSLVLEFDPQTLTWSSLGTREEHIGGKVQQAVLRQLRAVAPASIFAKELALTIGEKENSVRQALNRLAADRVIRRVGNAWAYPAEEEPL
jgi:hypothetical protein